MILTSNRVAIFDEVFKSRIQLTLYYPELSKKLRRKVWEKFVVRLSGDPIAVREIDIEDLRANLGELSGFDLNGREIRNAINVARLMAVLEARKLNFNSLKKVVKAKASLMSIWKRWTREWITRKWHEAESGNEPTNGFTG